MFATQTDEKLHNGMLGRRSRPRVITCLASAAFVAMTFSAQAETDFSGQTITQIIPYGPGGGTTAYARLMMEGLQQTLPGGPSIIAENIDGAGSIVGTNYFAANAEPDGLTFLAIGASTLLSQMFDSEAVNYDLTRMIPFTSAPTGSVVYGRTDYADGLGDDGIENTRKFIENPPVIAAQTLTSSDVGMLVAYDIMGIKPQVVFGLSLGESRAGLERGEFQMRHDTMASYFSAVLPILEDGTAKPLFTLGFEQDGEIVRDPVAPDIPHYLEVYEAIHGEPLSGIEYQVWKTLFDLRVTAGKMLLLPEGTPDEIVETYARAAAHALELPMMQEENAQLILGGYPQVVGAEASMRVLQGALGMDDEQSAWLENWATETYDGF